MSTVSLKHEHEHITVIHKSSKRPSQIVKVHIPAQIRKEDQPQLAYASKSIPRTAQTNPTAPALPACHLGGPIDELLWFAPPPVRSEPAAVVMTVAMVVLAADPPVDELVGVDVGVGPPVVYART